MLTFIAVQLFWLSFGLIGLGEVLAYKKLFPHSSTRKHIALLRRTHPIVASFIVVSIGFASFVPIAVPGYLLNLPLLYLVLAYVCVLLLASANVFAYRKPICHYIKTVFGRLLKSPYRFLILLALGVIVFDYLAALHVGSPVDFDTPIQIAKVNYFMNGHLSFADPYFGNHGVLDVRYSANLFNALLAVIGSLSRGTAIEMWGYSYGFFRLLMWGSLFSLTWVLLASSSVRRLWSYSTLIIAPFLLAIYFTYVELPNRIAVAWVVLLLIGLKLLLEKSSPGLLLVACLLIATAHTIVALFSLGFLVLCLAGLAATRQLPRYHLKMIICCIAILAVPVIANQALPSHINDDPATFNAGSISSNYRVVHYTSLAVASAQSFGPGTLLFIVAVAALYGLRRYVRARRLGQLISGLMFIVALLTYSVNAMSLFIYVYIIRLQKMKAFRLCIILMLCYYGLFIYNPVFMTLADGRIPPWLISRLGEFNVIGLLGSTLGMVLLLQIAVGSRVLNKVAALVPVASLACIYIVSMLISPLYLSSALAANPKHLTNRTFTPLRELSSQLSNQVVYTDTDTSILLPEVMHTRVIAINPSNSSPMSNTIARTACSKRLAALDANDLSAAGVTRLLVGKDDRKLLDTAQAKPYLKTMARTRHFTVFAVDVPQTVQPSLCRIPYGE